MTLAYAVLLCLHLLAAALWVGGMAVVQFAVRPSAAATLPPPQRLALMAATLDRLIESVGWAIVVLLVSGLAMIWIAGGFAIVHWGVHAMLAVGLAMMVIYGVIRWRLFAPLQRAVAAADWPQAGAALQRIRQWVEVNLILGVLVFAIATTARAI